mmetsp:Transcript_3607/g.10614  ORF Transcript_3607/g.10614 Transcript_3607/m.10614 type:complete len:249 (-) Transcript_3607:128-874(-)
MVTSHRSLMLRSARRAAEWGQVMGDEGHAECSIARLGAAPPTTIMDMVPFPPSHGPRNLTRSFSSCPRVLGGTRPRRSRAVHLLCMPSPSDLVSVVAWSIARDLQSRLGGGSLSAPYVSKELQKHRVARRLLPVVAAVPVIHVNHIFLGIACRPSPVADGVGHADGSRSILPKSAMDKYTLTTTNSRCNNLRALLNHLGRGTLHSRSLSPHEVCEKKCVRCERLVINKGVVDKALWRHRGDYAFEKSA